MFSTSSGQASCTIGMRAWSIGAGAAGRADGRRTRYFRNRHLDSSTRDSYMTTVYGLKLAPTDRAFNRGEYTPMFSPFDFRLSKASGKVANNRRAACYWKVVFPAKATSTSRRRTRLSSPAGGAMCASSCGAPDGHGALAWRRGLDPRHSHEHGHAVSASCVTSPMVDR